MFEMNTPLAAIVAMANNRVIGRDNQLPWHLPEDLQHFKQKTLGKPIIMGRKTFASIGRPLPGRCNIVISRQADFTANDIYVFNTIEKALQFADQQAEALNVNEIMLIGGAQLYAELLPWVQRLFITEIALDVADGDAFFPAIDPQNWREMARDCKNNGQLSYSFVEYQRIQ